MRHVLSDEQKMLRDALRGWLEETAPLDQVRKWLADDDHADFDTALDGAGWSMLGVAEGVGGQGGGLAELALMAEELGRAAAPASAWMATAVAMPVLEGEPDVLGTAAAAAALVDAGAPIGTRWGVGTDGANRLTGRVAMVLGADRAEKLVVPTNDGDQADLWLVSSDADGVRRDVRRPLDRTRGFATVELDGVAASRIDVDAEAVLATMRDRMAVLVAAGTVGACDRMLEMTVEYSRQREQFGRPIASFQAVKHAAAEMLVAIEPLRSVVRGAAQAVDSGMAEGASYAAVAKAQAGEVGVHVAESALTLHGAIGFTWEHDLQLFYKRVKLDRELCGQPSVWNERVADELGLLRTPGSLGLDEASRLSGVAR